MEILKIIRYTLSPNSYFEEDPKEFSKTKDFLSNEDNQNQFLYKMQEQENIQMDRFSMNRMEQSADKHWKEFIKTLEVPKNTFPSYGILYKLAAGLLFIINPWLIYQTLVGAFSMQENKNISENYFFFNVEDIPSWRNISTESSIFAITLPFLIFVISIFYRRQGQIIPIYYFLISLSVFLTWGYYGVTNSDSVIPIFTGSMIALFGILVFLKNQTTRNNFK